MNYSLIIPIYNEEKTLKELLNQLEKYIHKIEIIIINDGSTDKTKYILDQQDKFKIINNPYNRGKGYSLIAGIKLAANENIILMDGDLEIDISCIEDLIKKFELLKGHVVVGNRWINNINNKYDINTLGNYFLNQIFNLLYKTDLKDILCCAKVLKKRLLNSLNLDSNRFSIEAEIMSKLALNETKVTEVGIHYIRRTHAQGKKLKISDGWRILLRIIKVRFGIR